MNLTVVEDQDVGQSNVVDALPKRQQFSRMSPNQLFRFIHDDVTDAQHGDIQSIGFGSLLELKTYEYPIELCRWLLQHFNCFESCLEFQKKKLEVGIDYFNAILILPKIGRKIEEVGSRTVNIEHTNFTNDWLLQYPSKTKVEVTISDVASKMKEQTSGGDNFIRNFVVLVVSSLLKSNTKGVPNLKFMKCLAHVDLIKHYNWSQYALEALTDSCRDWQSSQGKSCFTRPVLPLVLCYLDRVPFMGRSVMRRFPLLSCWTKKEIFARCAYELKIASKYGKGQVIACFLVESKETEERQHADPNGDEKKACIHNVAECATNLSKAFSDFVEVIDDAKIKFPNRDAITKLEKLVRSMSKTFGGEPANEENKEPKADASEVEGSQVDGEKVDGDNLYDPDDDALFNDPILIATMERIDKSFRKRPISYNDFTPPSFDLSISPPDLLDNQTRETREFDIQAEEKRKKLSAENVQPFCSSSKLSLKKKQEEKKVQEKKLQDGVRLPLKNQIRASVRNQRSIEKIEEKQSKEGQQQKDEIGSQPLRRSARLRNVCHL